MMWTQSAFWLMSLPLLAAAGLWLADRWPRAQAVVGAGLACLLALWLWSVDLSAGAAIWPLFDRSFVLTPGLQTVFVYLSLSVGLLSLLAWPLAAGPRFVPVTVGLLAPAAALLMIRPFFLAAPFWLLLVVPALLLFRYEADRGLDAVPAAVRYWLLMLVAVTLLLLATWMLQGGQAALLLPGARLLALALGIMLAGFPFFIWVRPLATAVPLLALPVLLALLPLLALLLALQLFGAYPALGQTDAFLLWLPWSGGLTVLLAGFLTLSVTGWRSLVASLILLDMGFGLLALGLAGSGGWETAVIHHGLRLVSLLLVIGGLYLVNSEQYSVNSKQYLVNSEQYSVSREQAGVQAERRQIAWPGWLLVYGLLSLLGLPLTPGFSGRWAVLVELGQSAVASLPLALLLVAGMGLALLGVGRQIQAWLAAEPAATLAPNLAVPSGHSRVALALLLGAFLLAALPHLMLNPLLRLALLLQG
jgi:formate hydrogenlyase subunit 3/multisubunit Na+/H+ antiporter MnhD subunit